MPLLGAHLRAVRQLGCWGQVPGVVLRDDQDRHRRGACQGSDFLEEKLRFFVCVCVCAFFLHFSSSQLEFVGWGRPSLPLGTDGVLCQQRDMAPEAACAGRSLRQVRARPESFLPGRGLARGQLLGRHRVGKPILEAIASSQSMRASGLMLLCAFPVC
eukprot:scaffold1534_cov267-Pinguiococcus_pyrenoidosus.AAC.22